MSITVSDILKLPSLQGAKVVAGRAGLSNRFSTISVSEYTRKYQFKDVRFDSYVSELLISAFYEVKDSVEKQCDNIQGYYDSGIAGLILFYIGVILSEVDEKLIKLADSLNFPIIVMPENRPDLRYSEVIYEVTEAILKSHMIDYDFEKNIIEKVSRFPEYQQSVGAVMRIISDKTFSTIILADSAGKPLNASVWPRNLAVEEYLKSGKVVFDEIIELNGETYQTYVSPIKSSRGVPLQAVIYKRGDKLSPEVIRQIGETIQMSMNLWDKGNSANRRPELVEAILRDEPYKIRHIAALFGIKLQEIQDMWIICPANNEKAELLFKNVPRIIEDVLSKTYETVIFDIYDGNIIVLLAKVKGRENMFNIAKDFYNLAGLKSLEAIIIVCRNLDSPEKIRKTYFVNKGVLDTAREIYPLKTLFSFSEIKFASECKAIAESSESTIKQHTEILDVIPKDGRVSYQDMLKTISVYYLDAQNSVSLTGEILFLHKNTIQYRINKFREKTYNELDKLPAIRGLYLALALNRILKDSII